MFVSKCHVLMFRAQFSSTLFVEHIYLISGAFRCWGFQPDRGAVPVLRELTGRKTAFNYNTTRQEEDLEHRHNPVGQLGRCVYLSALLVLTCACLGKWSEFSDLL